MLLNQREAEGGAGIGGQHYAAFGQKNAKRAGGAHRIVVRRWQRAEVARLVIEMADLIAAADAVVVVVMRARDQLRRAGAAPGELEERHLIGRRRCVHRVLRWTVDGRRQSTIAGLITQQHDPQRAVLLYETSKKPIVVKQGMIAVGHQQRRFDLGRVGVQLAALMAEQGIHRRNANFQQGKEGDVELRHVAQLHQRGVACAQPFRLQ